MALVKDPQAKARGAKTRLQAARLKEELEMELALNDEAPAAWEEQADAALDILSERFDNLTDEDWTHSNAKWSPSISNGAKKGLTTRTADPAERQAVDRDAKRDSDPNDRDPEPTRRLHQRARPHVKAARRRGTARRRAGQRTRRIVREATPGLVGDWTTLFLQAIGGAVFLSLVFLLLRDANRPRNGRAAVEVAARTFAGGLQALISPKADVLPGGRAPKLAAAPTPTYNDQYEAGLVAGPPTPTRSTP